MPDTLIVNGNLVSWSSYVLRINGLSYTNLTEISYGDKLERAYGYGMSRSHAPIGRTAGKYTPDPVKIKVYQHVKDIIIQDLVVLSTDGTLANVPPFPIFLQYLEQEFSHSLLFAQCTIATITESITESTEAMMAEMEFMPLWLERDGITLFRQDQNQI